MTIDEVADYLRVGIQIVRWLQQEGRFASAVKVGAPAGGAGVCGARVGAANRESAELLDDALSIQRYTLASGEVRYRACVKSHGREVTTRVFERKKDAEAWEEEQKRRLRHGEWFDPRRGRIPLKVVAEEWLASRRTVKRRTAETDAAT